MRTFTDALAPLVADGSLTHCYPLSDRHGGSDIVGTCNATAHGGVTYQDDGAHFDGGGYLEFPDHPDFSAATTGELTVLAFVSITDWQGGPGSNADRLNIVAKGDPNDYEWAFRQYRSSTTTGRRGWLSFYHWNYTGGLGAGARVLDPTDRPDPMEPTDEMLIGGDVGGGDITAWRDGQWRQTNPLSGYNITPTDRRAPVTIATRADGEGYMIGSVRRVMFFNRRLAPAEHASIWEARHLPDAITLEQRVADLEARVSALEGSPPSLSVADGYGSTAYSA